VEWWRSVRRRVGLPPEARENIDYLVERRQTGGRLATLREEEGEEG
jgi:hypothetical protein